jgi:outer membrane receptor protein involved in Fe transport
MDYPSLPEMSETARFLTDAPRIQYIQPNENYVLYYLNGQSGDRMVIEADYATFELYDSSNNLITTFNQELNFSGTNLLNKTYVNHLSRLKADGINNRGRNIMLRLNFDL